jgi:sugar O-acyltransferase (sialic acid O-acetyltransferase NeuD family)
MKSLAVIGYGSFTKEIIRLIKTEYSIFLYNMSNMSNIEQIEKDNNCKCFDITDFNPYRYKALITISNNNDRKSIVKDLPSKTEFFTLISENAIIGNKNVIGEGSIICDGVILTTNIKLGKFNQINLNTTIGHDTVMGDYCTTAPGVNISGNCKIGENVYFGTNSSVKEKIIIHNNVILGLNAGVLKNITEEGVYIGTPATKMSKSN